MVPDHFGIYFAKNESPNQPQLVRIRGSARPHLSQTQNLSDVSEMLHGAFNELRSLLFLQQFS